MEQIFTNISSNFIHINWQGPAAFVVAILAILALLRKWSVILLFLLVVVIGWGAQDMIIMNLDTQDKLVSIPLLAYTIGGALVLIVAFFSFFKSK
jgi:hypothetical protein